MDLTGFLTINGTDAWTEYGAFLGETEEGGHVNMDALLRMPSAKDITTVDFRERVGVELPLNPDVKLNSIERTLQFWLRGTSVTDRLDKYQRMMTLITSGMLAIAVKITEPTIWCIRICRQIHHGMKATKETASMCCFL